MRELAVIIPTYNGGSRLIESVQSCGDSGLPADRYGVLVVDNCSTDGSTQRLPTVLGNGAPVHVWVNENNLGRTGNWNRGLEIAARESYTFAAFLFVGDTWAREGSAGELLNLMKQSGAVLGMAPLSIAAEDGNSCREGARISISGERAFIESQHLLHTMVTLGRLPFAPLQANLYRLFDENPLRFDTDPAKALNTDIESTARYLLEHSGTVALISRPFLVWREHSSRFLATQDPWFVMQETRATLRRVGEATGVAINWKSANAISLLTSAHELSRKMSPAHRLAFLWKVFHYLAVAPGGISIRNLLGFTFNKLFRNRSYLTLPNGYAVGGSTLSAHTPTSPRAVSRYGL